MWIKIAVQEIGPFTLVAFRVVFGLLFSLAVIRLQRVRWPRGWREWFPLLLLGLTNVAIPFVLISWGEQAIDSAAAPQRGHITSVVSGSRTKALFIGR